MNEQILSGIEKLSVWQLVQLTEALCRRFGVDPRTLYPQQTRVIEPVKAVEEQQAEFSVKLLSYDPAAKVVMIKLLREVTGLGLVDAKKMTESVPVVLKDGLAKADAEEIAGKLRAAGAAIEIH